MRLFVLGDEDAVLGFSLVGVSGRAARTPDEVAQGLHDVLADDSIGILLITTDAANLVREEVDRLMIAAELPLILEIPSASGEATSISIRRFIGEAIGVRL
jgi:V/A-type H+/Na+-transporting ATPase subunit F